MARIFWAGDSTVKRNTYETFPQTGIGQEFHRFTKKGIEIFNFAENGRSTKSFIDESRLAEIYNTLEEGDFFFIQFGHNDEKKEDKNRYTDPYTTFQDNLVKFINVARNKNAYPVLITSVTRRNFKEDGKLEPSVQQNYASAMENIAEKEDVKIINLYKKSRELVEEYGPKESLNLYMHIKPNKYPAFPEGLNDNTHLKPEGAFEFGKLIAEELEKLGAPYCELLI